MATRRNPWPDQACGANGRSWTSTHLQAQVKHAGTRDDDVRILQKLRPFDAREERPAGAEGHRHHVHGDFVHESRLEDPATHAAGDAQCARMLGLEGRSVDNPADVGAAWDEALAADRPRAGTRRAG